MTGAKAIVVKPISSAVARALVRRIHYSGKVTNSQLHLGVYLGDRLEGAMQFGPSIDKRKMVGLVEGTPWNGFLELNRMAFSDQLPKNSESRALGVALRMIRKQYPHIGWIVSFADGTQCGDGTIYRAAGFLLTGVVKNRQMVSWGDKVIAKKSLDNQNYPKVNGRYYSSVLIERGEAKLLDGFMLRYMYFLDPAAQARLTVPVLPYSKIDELGARMYRGQRQRAGSKDAVAPPDQGGEEA